MVELRAEAGNLEVETADSDIIMIDGWHEIKQVEQASKMLIMSGLQECPSHVIRVDATQ
jgi:hypothetical protein